MIIFKGKLFSGVLISLIVLSACNDSELIEDTKQSVNALPSVEEMKVQVKEASNKIFVNKVYEDADDGAYEHVVRFEKSGMFYWNNMPAALGDPIEQWISILGKPDRVRSENIYLWDELGIRIHTASRSKVLKDPTRKGIVHGITIIYDDRYDDLGQYSIGRDPLGSPVGYFTGLIRFGDAWIDRDRRVDEFLDYEATKTLHNTFGSPMYFRDTFENEGGLSVLFSITQGLSRAFPEGPDNVTAYIH